MRHARLCRMHIAICCDAVHSHVVRMMNCIVSLYGPFDKRAYRILCFVCIFHWVQMEVAEVARRSSATPHGAHGTPRSGVFSLRAPSALLAQAQVDSEVRFETLNRSSETGATNLCSCVAPTGYVLMSQLNLHVVKSQLRLET